MRKLLSVLVLVLCPSVLWADGKSVIVEDWTKPSSVYVCKKMQGRNGCGSGTVIYADKEGYLVLTCYHVAGGEDGTIVVRPEVDGVEKPGKVASSWPQHDMVVIYVKDSKHKVRAAKVAQQVSYAQGLNVRKCGYPGAGPRHVAQGTSLGVQSTGNGVLDWYSVQYNLLTRSGDSGGGLFRDSDHALIGVVWGGSNGIGFATRIESIWKMMGSLEDNGWIRKEVEKEAARKLILYMPPQSVLEYDR